MSNISEEKKYTKPVKCPYCNISFDRNIEPFVKHSNRWYHKHCHDEYSIKAQHYKELIDYICKLYNIKSPRGLMIRQIKEFQEELGYTLKGIELSLRYFHDYLEHEPDARGIGIVPYVYEDAKKHYVYFQNIKQQLEKELDKQIKIRPITISTKHRKKEKQKYRIEEL